MNRSRMIAKLARIDQEIAAAEVVSRDAASALVRQQAKMLMESLKLDREAIEKLIERPKSQ
jgi:hypothetical protein